MLGLILLGLIAYQLGKIAFDKGRKRYVWWILTIAVWFGAQFIGGIIVGIFGGIDSLNDAFTATIAGLVSSVLGITGLWMYLRRLPDRDADLNAQIDEIGYRE